MDINHVFHGPFDYITEQYIKPTAKNSLYLNGNSFHPQSVFKSIVKSQIYRNTCLHSTKEGFLKGIETIRDKAQRSEFKAQMLQKEIQRGIDNYAGQLELLNKVGRQNTEEEIITFATQFPGQHPTLRGLKSDSGKKLVVTYKKPPTIGTLLPATKYRKIANEEGQSVNAQSPCGHGNCRLCPMIEHKTCIRDSTSGKIYKLAASLNCQSFGIYILRCKRCTVNEAPVIGHYVGRTVTKFNQRFSQHRKTFSEGIQNQSLVNTPDSFNSDKYALSKHYIKCHPEMLNNGTSLGLEEAYELFLVDSPKSTEFLAQLEDRWFHRIHPNINIMKMTTENIHSLRQ